MMIGTLIRTKTNLICHGFNGKSFITLARVFHSPVAPSEPVHRRQEQAELDVQPPNPERRLRARTDPGADGTNEQVISYYWVFLGYNKRLVDKSRYGF
jgi:hypothetical protein